MRRRRKRVVAGPFIKSARAKKRPGRTVAVGGTQVIRKAKKKPVAFTKGGLHSSVGVAQGKKIPASKVEAALEGKYGKKAAKQARFYKNVLKKGQATARRHRKR